MQRPTVKVQIALAACTALIAAGVTACGGTSSTPTANASSPAPANAGTPAPGSSSGSSGSGAASAGSSSGSSSGGSNSGGSSGGNSQGPIAFAYVGTAGRATTGIYGFSIGRDGSASAVTGSPAAGPSGYVVANSAFVFASDTADIASYERSSDGSLQQSSSTYAVLSNGTEPWVLQTLSLDHTGQSLYAVENAGSDDLYYFFFSVAPNGNVTNIGKIGPNTNYVSTLVFSPDNNYAYGGGCFHLGWEITVFRRNSNGALAPLNFNTAGIPAYAGIGQFYCPQGRAISQTGYLAIADTALNTNTSGLGTYKINPDGSLSFVQNSTLATQLSNITGLNFDRSGIYLAVAGNGGIQMYQLTSAGTLTPMGGVQQAGTNFLAVQWDVDNHLYAISSSGLYVFTNSQGVLTSAPGSPHAVASAAATLVVLPTH